MVGNQAGDWFEPPVWVAAVGGGPQMIRPVSPVAVRIAAADFDELAGRFEDDGTVEGFATLTGIWSAGQLYVQHQAVPPHRCSFAALGDTAVSGSREWLAAPC